MSDIVVGVDGSPCSVTALRWALTEARLRGVTVRAVLAWAPEGRPAPIFERCSSFDPEVIEKTAAAYLHETVANLDLGDPPVKIVERLVYQHPVGALVAESAYASMLVVGARGIGPVRRIMAGSISSGCAQEADAPVVVVRGTPGAASDRRPILAGVDGSTASITALAWAAGEAKLRGVPLRAVHAWHIPPGFYNGFYALPDPAIRESARALLDDALTKALGTTPDVDVQAELLPGWASPALIEAAGQAQLLVVGARGHGGFTGLMLGSTSHQCVLHAPCPTAVIREPVTRPAIIPDPATT